jgi:hypothetical protein
LLNNYVEQRELQAQVGELIVTRELEILAVTADALTPGLLSLWEAKYGGDNPAPRPPLLTNFIKEEERNGNCSI